MSLAARGCWSTHSRRPIHGLDCGVPPDQRAALTDSGNHALPQPTSSSPSLSELTARTAMPLPPPRRRRPRLPRRSNRVATPYLASLCSKKGDDISPRISRAPSSSVKLFGRPFSHHAWFRFPLPTLRYAEPSNSCARADSMSLRLNSLSI